MSTKLSHLSVGIPNPKRAAEALAQLSNGEVKVFHPVPGSYVCLWGGWRGQFVEFYPKNVSLVPTPKGTDFCKEENVPKYSSVHLNLDVGLHGDEVKQIAEKFAYPYHFRPADGGPLHEVWLEGELCVELVTRELESRA